MVQVGESPSVKNGPGMEDRYYSICAEPLLSPRKKLGDYICQDASTFLLNEDGIARMTSLCQFNEPNRGGDGAPVNIPQEWRYLDKILADEDTAKSDSNLREVEIGRHHPSEVWAERAMELFKLEWDKWLFQVNSILKTVSLGDDFSTDEARITATRLVSLIGQLDKKDQHQETT